MVYHAFKELRSLPLGVIANLTTCQDRDSKDRIVLVDNVESAEVRSSLGD